MKFEKLPSDRFTRKQGVEFLRRNGAIFLNAMLLAMMIYSTTAFALGGNEGCLDPPICSILMDDSDHVSEVRFPGGWIYINVDLVGRAGAGALLCGPNFPCTDCDSNQAECIEALEDIYDAADAGDAAGSDAGGTAGGAAAGAAAGAAGAAAGAIAGGAASAAAGAAASTQSHSKKPQNKTPRPSLSQIKRTKGMALKAVPGAKVKQTTWRQVKRYFK